MHADPAATTQLSLQTLAANMKPYPSFLLLLHQSPDGDSLGASLGLALALEQLGKEVQVAYVDYLPEQFSYLPEIQRLKHWRDVRPGFAAAVLCDCSSPARVGEAVELLRAGLTVFNIDHHPDNESFGDYNYVDPQAAAVGEIIFRLLPHLRVELTPAIAHALYLAILTDTGGFRYASTTPDTHRIAAELIAAGVDVREVTSAVYENRPLRALRLLARALNTLRRHPELPVAWMVLRHADLVELKAQPEDTDEIINYARSLRGVEVAFFIREEGNGELAVSFRSRRKVHVGRLAAEFGGGGHARAAGCQLRGITLEAAVERILTLVTRYLQ